MGKRETFKNCRGFKPYPEEKSSKKESCQKEKITKY